MADNNTEILLKLKAIDELTPVMIKAVEAMQAQTAALTDSMSKLAETTVQPKEGAEKLNTGMLNLASTMNVVKGAVELATKAWHAIESAVDKAIEEAVSAEKAERQLTSALAATGKYTLENIEIIEAYAETVKKATGYSDEQVKIMVAQGVQMGLSVQRAQELELAARNLAKATGKDVNDAFTLLTSSVAGQSRGLAKILPQVKELTEAQLKSGGAAELVNRMFAQGKDAPVSYATAMRQMHTALDDVYKAFGQQIIQSPIVIKGIQLMTQAFETLTHGIESAFSWIEANQAVLEQLGKALLVIGGAVVAVMVPAMASWAIAAAAAVTPTAALGAAVALLTSPVTIVIAAVTALTYAFMKWPGLFDQIIGSIKMFAGMFVESWTLILGAAAKVASVFDKDLGASITRAQTSMQAYADKLQLAGAKQIDLGTEINKTGEITFKAAGLTDEHTRSLDKVASATSDAALAQEKLIKSYAGVRLATLAQQQDMNLQIQDREQDLKRFTDYLESKKRLAVSKQQEQNAQLAALRAKEVGGTGGEESLKAGYANQIAIEQTHQAQLAALRKTGAITKAQYDEEMFESSQKIRTLEIQSEQAHQQALADVYANSPAGFEARKAKAQADFDSELAMKSDQLSRLGQSEQQIADFQKLQRAQFQKDQYDQQAQHDQQMIALATQTQQQKAAAMGDTPEAMQVKQQLEEQTFQLELAQKMQHAQQEGLTDLQIQQMKEQSELDHKNRMQDIEVQYYDNEAARQEKAGNDWEAFLARRNAAAAQHGAVMGTLQTVQNSQYFKAEMDMLGNLATLRNSGNKKQFEAGKAAAIAQATVQTFLGATQAFTSLSSIPIVGPILGAVAAAAAIAAGMQNISSIKSQQFQGGQADSGMDAIPQQLDGKSFTLSAGERVVQPTANQDLTAFLEKQKMEGQPGNGGGGSKGTTIILNYNGMGSKEDAKKMADIVIQEIRTRSERGTPVISSKGVTG